MVACSMGALTVLTGFKELGLEAGEPDFPSYVYSEDCSMRPSFIPRGTSCPSRSCGWSEFLTLGWFLSLRPCSLSHRSKSASEITEESVRLRGEMRWSRCWARGGRARQHGASHRYSAIFSSRTPAQSDCRTLISGIVGSWATGSSSTARSPLAASVFLSLGGGIIRTA